MADEQMKKHEIIIDSMQRLASTSVSSKKLAIIMHGMMGVEEDTIQDILKNRKVKIQLSWDKVSDVVVPYVTVEIG